MASLLLGRRTVFATTAWVYLVAIASSVAVSSATRSATSSLDWPYSELFVNLTSQVERCSKVSGFQFRNNTRPNVQQLARMCADPDCIGVTNTILASQLKVSLNESYAAALVAFTVPVLDYCWYMREPGTPCPADKWSDFLSHVIDKDANCARVTGYSFVNSSMKTWALPSDKPCPSDCWPLGARLYLLNKYMPCPQSDAHAQDAGIASFAAGIQCWMQWKDDQGLKPASALVFAYTPGWPLPPTPTAAASVTPTPPDTESSSSASTDPEITPETGFTDEEELTLSTKRVPTTQPSQAPSNLEATAASTYNDHGEELVDDTGSFASPSPTKTAHATSTISTAQGEPELKTEIPRAAAAPDVTASSTTSDQHLLPVLGASTVGLVLFAAIFIVSKRRHKGNISKEGKEGDDEFTTLNSPSAENKRRPTAHWSSQGAKMSLATITKAIPVKHIQDIRMIGTGGYGVVYLVRDTANNRLLASKRLAYASEVSNDRIDAFVREIQLVSTIQHPCIVTFIGATWTNRTDVQALFEYMDGGDLRTYLNKTPLPAPHAWTSEKLSIAIDIADALDYIHSARDRNTPLVHRDLKSRNVLLSMSPRRAKLSDFGVSRELSNNMSMTDGVGTSRWLAPEVILGGGDYGTACDVYSFGVVLSELDTHKLPFWDCGGGGDGGGADRLDSVVPEIVILRMVAMEGVQPSFSASCPYELLELARQCLSHNPSDRPTVAAIAKTLKNLLVK